MAMKSFKENYTRFLEAEIAREKRAVSTASSASTLSDESSTAPPRTLPSTKLKSVAALDLQRTTHAIEFQQFLKNALSFIQSNRSKGSLPLADVFRAAGVDAHDSRVPQLLAELPIADKRIRVTSSAIEYAAPTVSSLSALLARIQEKPEGLGSEELTDVYDGWEEDIRQLQKQRKVMLLFRTATMADLERTVLSTDFAPASHRGQPRAIRNCIIFPNEASLVAPPLSPEIRRLWTGLSVPDKIDLEQSLRAAGVRPQRHRVENEKSANAGAPRKRKRRSTRILNRHMDLSLLTDLPSSAQKK